MSACDTCCRPGACCREFTLNFRVPASDWKVAAHEMLGRHGLDFFQAVRPFVLHEGVETIQVMFSCDRLGADGRCTQYDERPPVCRIFEPMSDPLCVKRQPMLRGIPIMNGPVT